MNDLSNIIREFEKLTYKSYERRRPKHEPTDSYFYLAIQISKCMMRADTLNSHIYPVRTEMTGTKKDFDLAHWSYKQELIRGFTSGRKIIVDLFYGQGQIKRHHHRCNFYRGKRIIMRP